MWQKCPAMPIRKAGRVYFDDEARFWPSNGAENSNYRDFRDPIDMICVYRVRLVKLRTSSEYGMRDALEWHGQSSA